MATRLRLVKLGLIETCCHFSSGLSQGNSILPRLSCYWKGNRPRNYSLSPPSWHNQRFGVNVEETVYEGESSPESSRIISPVTAEVLKSIQYGRERWMEQSQRNFLVKKYEEGIIDNTIKNEKTCSITADTLGTIMDSLLCLVKPDKLTLEHLQILWPEGKPIWIGYRRNHKGQFAPQKTRERCIRGKSVCGNPCPLCRLTAEKNYQVIYGDVGLLSQFICPHSGLIIDAFTTGSCQRLQRRLIQAIEEARDKGLLPFTIPGQRDQQRRLKAVGKPFGIKNKIY